MSYDRLLDQVCPHMVAEEALFVSPLDRQTVVSMQPIASSQSVQVRYNGVMSVPPNGVQLSAQVTGSKSGPFNILKGSNDTLVVSVDQGSDQTIVVPATNQVDAVHLAALMNLQVQGMVFTTSGPSLGLKTASVGIGSSVFVRSSSTLAATLGITVNREYRGVQACPGWAIIVDPKSIPQNPIRLIVFDEPLKGFNDYVEIAYTTLQNRCRRCNGLGVENDWRYGTSGEVAQARDEALLIQEVEKLFFTVLGSNPFYSWYGTRITDSIGKKIAAGGLVQNNILQDVYQAFSQWQSVKRQQEDKIGQFLTDEEYPYRLVSVTLNTANTDPTMVLLSATVQNRSQKQFQIDRGIVLPQPLDLLGSTPQVAQVQRALSGFIQTG